MEKLDTIPKLITEINKIEDFGKILKEQGQTRQGDNKIQRNERTEVQNQKQKNFQNGPRKFSNYNGYSNYNQNKRSFPPKGKIRKITRETLIYFMFRSGVPV